MFCFSCVVEGPARAMNNLFLCLCVLHRCSEFIRCAFTLILSRTVGLVAVCTTVCNTSASCDTWLFRRLSFKAVRKYGGGGAPFRRWAVPSQGHTGVERVII